MGIDLSQLDKDQQERLLRIAKVADRGDGALIDDIFDLEDNIKASFQAVDSALQDMGKKVENVKTEKGDKGDDGDNYVLSGDDIEEIASIAAKKVVVPVVEKVIETVVEKTETVIREIPIVKEVAVPQANPERDQTLDALLTELKTRVDSIEAANGKRPIFGSGSRPIRVLNNGTTVSQNVLEVNFVNPTSIATVGKAGRRVDVTLPSGALPSGNNGEIQIKNGSAFASVTNFKASSTVPGFGYSANTLRGLFDLYVPVGIGSIPSGTITQIDNGGGNVGFFGSFFEFNIYAYKTIGTVKVYSPVPFDLQITDNADSSNGWFQLNWSAVSGAAGYYIYCVEDDWFGFGGTGLDVGNVLTSNFGDGTEGAYTGPPTFTSSTGADIYVDANGNFISQNTGTFAIIDSPLFEPAGGAMTFHSGVAKKVNFKMEPSGNSMIRFGKDADGLTTQRMFQFTDTNDTVEYFIFAIDPTGQPMISTQAKTHFFIGNAPSGIPIVKFDFDTSNGRLGIGQTSPTAALHLKAGSTAAGSAPVKFTSGSLLTSAEAGAHEFLTDSLYITITTGTARKEIALVDATLTSGKIPVATTNGRITNASQTGYAKLSSGTLSAVTTIPVADGGTGQTASRRLFTHFADAGNGTTVETDLYSDSIGAGKLATNGDMIESEYAGTFVSSGTATREVKIYFGGTAIFDTGALTVSLSAAWTAFVNIIRVSSSVVRYAVSFTTEGAALAAYTAVGELTGLTLANAQVMKVTGQAGGVGAATNDIVAKIGYIDYEPVA